MESAIRTAAPGAGSAREELLDLVVGEVAHGGWCVAREPGGRVVFVRHALPGERVRARVTDATARFARAEAVQILQASPDRVEPPCPHARPGGCGGCDWQHASPDAQRTLKAEVIRQQLRRIAGLDLAVAVEPLPGGQGGLGWRTRIRYSVGPGGATGLLRHRSHEVVEVGDCPLAHPLVHQAGVAGQRWEQVSSLEVAVSPGSGERAVTVTPAPGRRPRAARPAAGEPSARQSVAAHAVASLAGQVDTVLVSGPGGRLTTLRGRGYLRQSAAGRTWRVAAGTFWQVHPGAADALTAAVLAALAPGPGDVALDLFCGAGLFAGALAEAVGPDGAVIGVEGDRAAVRDARHNLRGSPWVRVHHGDVATMLAGEGWPAAQLAVLDPPRTGAGRALVQHLLRPGAGLRRVAYVSCDPATLARDIAVFAELGWRLAALRAFDAFPMTHHVECVATLVPVDG
ncbi:MAG TPA: TRAM domain-containing protein [Streptosporangiaceae bacterium]|nr:TRAM domain-containing protein [Streptosporangiaceae bacterium]